MDIPPGLLQHLGNHKSFACNMIYQVQQQKCMKSPRAALLAPVHLLGMDGATYGVHDVDISVRLLKHEQQQLRKQLGDVFNKMCEMHGEVPVLGMCAPHVRYSMRTPPNTDCPPSQRPRCSR